MNPPPLKKSMVFRRQSFLYTILKTFYRRARFFQDPQSPKYPINYAQSPLKAQSNYVLILIRAAQTLGAVTADMQFCSNAILH